jgi:hypothetical protein
MSDDEKEPSSGPIVEGSGGQGGTTSQRDKAIERARIVLRNRDDIDSQALTDELSDRLGNIHSIELCNPDLTISAMKFWSTYGDRGGITPGNFRRFSDELTRFGLTFKDEDLLRYLRNDKFKK